MAGDYGSMTTRIADELARSDLTSQIALAVQSAIRHYEHSRFWFNETTGTFSTVASQEYYNSTDFADMPNIIEIDSVYYAISSTNGYTLDPETFAWIDQNASLLTGDSTKYCYYKQNMRLWTIPSLVRTITIAYCKRLSALANATDTNAWMTDGEELIRGRAKWDLFINVVRGQAADTDGAKAKALELNALDALDSHNMNMMGTGRVTASTF